MGTLMMTGLLGCTQGADSSFDSSSGASAAVSSAGATSDPSAAASASAPVLPASCDQIIKTVDVDKTLAKQLPGTTAYVVGEPQPDIKRTARATCSYGVQAGQPTPLQASLFVYADEQAAKDRVDAFVNSSRAGGSTSAPTTVGSITATVLTGATDSTIVFQDKERVYSITLTTGVLTPDQVPTALQQLAIAMQAAVAG